MPPRRSSTPPPPLRNLGAALAVTVLGIGVVSLVVDGFASTPLLRLLQGICLFGLGTGIVIGTVSLVVVRLGGWRDPEADFDQLVERSERLSRWPDPATFEPGAPESRGSDAPGFNPPGFDTGAFAAGPVGPGTFEPDTFEFGVNEMQADGLEVASEDEAFDALVRAAMDELPLEFHRALEHVAIIVSDSGAGAIGGRGGRRRGAYGMYQGDTVAHDYFTERILIFRDTLQRDFGHDPELLRSQVRRVLRHELAHHLGWGERGVRNLGL